MWQIPSKEKNWIRLHTEWVAIGPSIRGEVPFEFIKHAKSLGIKIALDVQGYVRVLRGQNPLSMNPGRKWMLSCHTWISSKAMQSKLSFSQENRIFVKQLNFMSIMAQEKSFLTHRDGLQIYADGKFHDREFHPETLIGRSGRGDTCVGSYVASRITKDPSESATWAAAVTSLKMEKPCPYDRSLTELKSFIA